jgi:hypothetical protein
MDWIDLAKDREGSYGHGNEHSGSIKCWEFLEYLPHLHLWTETNPVSETSCFFGIQDDGKVQKNSVNSVQTVQPQIVS